MGRPPLPIFNFQFAIQALVSALPPGDLRPPLAATRKLYPTGILLSLTGPAAATKPVQSDHSIQVERQTADDACNTSFACSGFAVGDDSTSRAYRNTVLLA